MAGVITPDLERRFATYSTLRNRIVHDYDRVDGQELIKRAAQLPADVRALLGVLTST